MKNLLTILTLLGTQASFAASLCGLNDYTLGTPTVLKDSQTEIILCSVEPAVHLHPAQAIKTAMAQQEALAEKLCGGTGVTAVDLDVAKPHSQTVEVRQTFACVR